MQSSQLNANKPPSFKATTGAKSSNSLASQIRSLLDSGDARSALTLLTDRAGDAFNYDQDILAPISDLLAEGRLNRSSFSSAAQEQKWNSILDNMPTPLLKSLISNLKERHRGHEAVNVLARRATAINKRHDPKRTQTGTPSYTEIVTAFSALKTDEIDSKWLLTEMQNSAYIFGDTLLAQACAQAIMTRDPTPENLAAFARATFLHLRTQSPQPWSEKAPQLLPILEVLAEEGAANDITFRQLRMETLIALGKGEEAVAEFEKSPSSRLVPWLREANHGRPMTIEYDTKISTIPEMIQVTRWASALVDFPTAITAVEERSKEDLEPADTTQLFYFVLSDLPPLPETFTILERLARKYNTPPMLQALAAYCIQNGNTPKAAELLEVAKHHAPEGAIMNLL